MTRLALNPAAPSAFVSISTRILAARASLVPAMRFEMEFSDLRKALGAELGDELLAAASTAADAALGKRHLVLLFLSRPVV